MKELVWILNYQFWLFGTGVLRTRVRFKGIVKMVFEVGKFYRHMGSGQDLAIVGEVNTTMYGHILVAEVAGSKCGTGLIPVGTYESCAENYEEITFEEWMKNFSK